MAGKKDSEATGIGVPTERGQEMNPGYSFNDLMASPEEKERNARAAFRKEGLDAIDSVVSVLECLRKHYFDVVNEGADLATKSFLFYDWLKTVWAMLAPALKISLFSLEELLQEYAKRVPNAKIEQPKSIVGDFAAATCSRIQEEMERRLKSSGPPAMKTE